MKISILTPDFSQNCFGRAWLLANILRKHYDIEIVGPKFGEGIWKPLEFACDFEMHTVKGRSYGRFPFIKMAKQITGDIIYASKPLMASFGVGLVKKWLSGKPLLLDIDDWELGLAKQIYESSDWRKNLSDFVVSMVSWRSYYHIAVLDKLTFLADHITVSGNILQSMFGGTIIWHARDSNLLNPARFNRNDLRKKYFENIDENLFIVGFIGTPRPHKGLEDLIDAMLILSNYKIMLIIVGIDDSIYCKKLQNNVIQSGFSDKVSFFPLQSVERLPEFLILTDLVVIPQRDTLFSYGQVPAKIFDAMAMAKPIVATKVSEIPEIMNGCGWIVPPGQPKRLAETIRYVHCQPKEAIKKGERAYQKFCTEYSLEVMEKRLAEVIERFRYL